MAIFKRGDVFQYLETHPKEDLFFTANSTINNVGELVMGAGIALEIKKRHPSLPKVLGSQIEHLSTYGVTITNTRVHAFQTKIHWRANSDHELIKLSCRLLARLANKDPTRQIHLNFPGIGLGKLNRDSVVHTVKQLPDNVTVWEKYR